MWNGKKNPRYTTSPMADSFKGINVEEKSAWIVDQLELSRFLKLPTYILSWLTDKNDLTSFLKIPRYK